jgi:tetratricopeptide (TPR) repeat protein
MAKVSINQVVAKAERLERAGNFKKAAEAYGAILKSGITNDAARNGYLRAVNRFTKPPTDKLVFQKQITEIATLIEKGEWATSESQSARLIKTFPNNVLLLNMNGVALLGLGNAKRAAELLNLALALKPDYADAHQNLGLALQQTNQPEAALKAFEKAIEFNPKFAKAYDNLGSMHQFFGRFEEAIEYHKSSLVIDPSSLEAHRNAAVAYRKLKFYTEALAEYRFIIEAGEVSAQNYYGVATLLRKLESPTEALVFVDKALSIDPLFVNAHLERGNSLRLLSRKDEAKQSYQTAINIDPKSARGYFGLSSVTKFERGAPEIATLLDLVADESISLEDQSLLNFTLAHAHDHFADLDASFIYLSKGNNLRKKALEYKIETDVQLFLELKEHGHKVVSQQSIDQTPLEFSPIFILGMPRSGTTLTEQIISAHSDVTGCGELSFAAQYGMSIARGETEISPQSIAKFRESYIRAVSTVGPQTKFFTDKMPHNFRLIGLLASAFPEAKIIHTQRNPAAVCWSNYYISFGASGLGYSYDLKDVVDFYKLYQDMVDYWNSLLTDRIYNLDYEKLTQNQEIETKRLIEYLDIGWDDACLSPEKNERKVLTASHSQVKKSVYKGSSQKWKRYEPYLDGAFDKLTN